MCNCLQIYQRQSCQCQASCLLHCKAVSTSGLEAGRLHKAYCVCRTDSPGRARHDAFQLPHSFEWRIQPDQLKIAKRPDGRDHKLGAGGFGTVSFCGCVLC